jgi:hypothetical protein
MKDRDFDIAMLEIKLKNDELVREWYLWKLGRRGELLNAATGQRAQNPSKTEEND